MKMRENFLYQVASFKYLVSKNVNSCCWRAAFSLKLEAFQRKGNLSQLGGQETVVEGPVFFLFNCFDLI